MDIQQLMKRAPACIEPSASLEQAAAMMNQLGCGILPVTDGTGSGLPAGVITDRDIVLRCIAQGRDARVMTVGDALTSPAICCDDDCSAEDAFHTMREHRIGRLLVIDARGKVAGIVSLADLIARVPREIWSQLPGAEKPLPRQKAA